MSPLVCLSIFSVSCWLNLAYGMKSEMETAQDLQNQASALSEPAEPEPEKRVRPASILNLDHKESQEAFLNELIPIVNNYDKLFYPYSKFYRIERRSKGEVYVLKIDKYEKTYDWFQAAKDDIKYALGNEKSQRCFISPYEKTTLCKLKDSIDFYLNPFNGRFKTSDIYKILADSEYTLNLKHHKRKSVVTYLATQLFKEGKEGKKRMEIDVLLAEDLKHVSSTSLSIEKIFNPEKKATKEELETYYDKLDKQSDPATITTRSIMYYALAHLCGVELLKKYVLKNILQKINDQTEKRTASDVSQPRNGYSSSLNSFTGNFSISRGRRFFSYDIGQCRN